MHSTKNNQFLPTNLQSEFTLTLAFMFAKSRKQCVGLVNDVTGEQTWTYPETVWLCHYCTSYEARSSRTKQSQQRRRRESLSTAAPPSTHLRQHRCRPLIPQHLTSERNKLPGSKRPKFIVATWCAEQKFWSCFVQTEQYWNCTVKNMIWCIKNINLNS